jgi:hypothetical protein
MTLPFHTPYPGYDVLAKWRTPSYNDQTRELFERRATPPPRRFFTEEEWRVLEALCARVIPQRRPRPVPIAAWIDAACFEERGTGTWYETMPDNLTAWRRGLAAIDAEAHARHATGFATLDGAAQDRLLKAVDKDDLAARDAWGDMPAMKFFRHTALKQIVSIYYTQPDAMSEIGYGGPASPRGYVRLGPDSADGWEAPLARLSARSRGGGGGS